MYWTRIFVTTTLRFSQRQSRLRNLLEMNRQARSTSKTAKAEQTHFVWKRLNVCFDVKTKIMLII